MEVKGLLKKMMKRFCEFIKVFENFLHNVSFAFETTEIFTFSAYTQIATKREIPINENFRDFLIQ